MNGQKITLNKEVKYLGVIFQNVSTGTVIYLTSKKNWAVRSIIKSKTLRF